MTGSAIESRCLTTIPFGLRLGLILLLFLLVGGVLWDRAQPRYEGRTAREWFRMALQSDGMQSWSIGRSTVETPQFRECAKAFQHMESAGIGVVVEEYLKQTPIYLEWYDKVVVGLQPVVKLPSRRQSNDFQESIVAHRLLLRIGQAAIPELIRKARSRRPEVRAQVATILGELGPGSPEAQACLVRMLGDASPRVIYGSLEVVWMTLPEPKTAIPLIVPFLTHTNSRVRVEASYAIGRFPPISEPGFAILLTLLSDSDVTVRANATRAIGLSGIRSAPVLASLEARLDDSNPVTRFRAAEALARLGGLDASNRTTRLLEVITEAEHSPRPYFRLIGFNARSAMGMTGSMGESMIDTFQQLLADPAPYARCEALESLTLYCGTNPPPPPAIRALLVSSRQDPNGLVRQQAMHVPGE